MRILGRNQAPQPAPLMEEPRPLGAPIEPESAALFEEFMGVGRSFDQLYQLWKDPEVTDPTVRQRAVTILTAPNGYEPSYARTDPGLIRLLNISERVDGKQTRSLRERVADQPELSTELAAGVLYWLDTTGGQIGDGLDSRPYYQSAIRELLPVVEEPIADELYAHYGSENSGGKVSPSNSARNLLVDPGVPDKYKHLEVAKWLAMAEQEALQVDAEALLRQGEVTSKLAEFLTVFGNAEGVDDVIDASIVAFLESRIPVGQTYVHGLYVEDIAQHIADQDLRFQFVLRHLSGSKEDVLRFNIRGEKDMALVKWMREEAAKRDLPEFEAEAQELIQDYERRRRAQAATHAAELSLQARLRGKQPTGVQN